jgi:osmotically-inducible protein OsmY
MKTYQTLSRNIEHDQNCTTSNTVTPRPNKNYQKLSTYSPIMTGITHLHSGLHKGVAPKGYIKSDERIFEDVCEALTAQCEIDASEIVVHVKNGIVSLTGSVDSKYVKRIAENTISDLSGVLDVKNDLLILTGDKNPIYYNNEAPINSSSQ